MNRLFFLAASFLLAFTIGVDAQSGAPRGITPCFASSISASGTSSNVQLSQCGPTVILMNLTSQEAFFNIGSTSSVTASASTYSLPGGAYLVIVVPTPNPGLTLGWWLAGFTATSSTTIRVIQGTAQ